MILKHFYDEKLAQASYLVGCAATGEALVVDPSRDIEPYLLAAEQAGLRITHVTETHIHADFVSGARELADRTGARLYLSGMGGAEWKYGFASEHDAVLLKDWDSFRVGNVRVEALHTPGHTPEHMVFVVTDTAAADQPMGVFTGDLVFVGDVGRPDLLERAAGYQGTMEAAAHTLFRSLRRFKESLPAFAQIWPGHGAGSACGKSLGAVPQTTVGYEKLFNWALAETDEARFVESVLSGQPEPPKYFAQMKRINRDGPAILHGLPRPEHLTPERLPALLLTGALVVDARSAAAFAAGHIPGTLNIPLNRSFNTWAGWLLPYDQDIYLIVESGEAAEEAVHDLAMIGLDRVRGYFLDTAIAAWEGEARPLGTVAQISPDVLGGRLETGQATLLDVRGAAEWDAGHIPQASHIPLGYLADRLGELPRDRPVVVQCQGGARSAIAASLLQARGFDEVLNLAGGYQEWVREGRPVELEAPVATAA